MLYRVIGVMSGSSLDGLDIAFTELHENAGKWTYEIVKADCYAYSNEWTERLRTAISLNAMDYQLLHCDYGHYIGREINRFIEENNLHYKVALIASHGHTTFHVPAKGITAQLGDGASIAAETGLPIVSDLRAMDVALGGQGAPIVPVGEKLLLNDYEFFLNIGGIANISFIVEEKRVAFDVCAANRVLNMLVNELGKNFDDGGRLAASGTVDKHLLETLNALGYYGEPYPKSLANDFGTDTVYPLIKQTGISIQDALATYTEHIALQIRNAVSKAGNHSSDDQPHLLVTGGGAFNTFLVERIQVHLQPLNIKVVVPDDNLVKYKEALVMALMGALRWRQEYNVLSSVTGGRRNSIGGALWDGQDA